MGPIDRAPQSSNREKTRETHNRVSANTCTSWAEISDSNLSLRMVSKMRTNFTIGDITLEIDIAESVLGESSSRQEK